MNPYAWRSYADTTPPDRHPVARALVTVAAVLVWGAVLTWLVGRME